MNNSIFEDIGVVIDLKVGILESTKELLEDSNNVFNKLTEIQKKTKEMFFETIVVYDEKIQKDILGYNEMKKDIQVGIENDEFILYLQPILNVITNKVVAFEALLRWNNPKYINISPIKYINAAEEIDSIGQLIIDKF